MSKCKGRLWYSEYLEMGDVRNRGLEEQGTLPLRQGLENRVMAETERPVGPTVTSVQDDW